MKVSVDTTEARALAADMRQVHPRLARAVKPVVKRGAVNIQKDMRGQLRKSRYFKGAAPGITFDLLDAGYTAEIGPERGGAGAISIIGYLGGAHGGGGTVEDPQEALNREVEGFAKAMAAVAAEVALG